MKKIFLFTLAVAVSVIAMASAPQKPATIVAASYNLRQANHSDSVAGNGWGRRLPVLADLIRFHGFEIFGTQEGFKPQLEGLKALLPGYEYTGKGRDDGKDAGEHSAIFYRTDLFELLDSGDFWMSETPEVPGKGWDAVLPRICSWGKFLHYPSGRVFVFMSLHMDHVGKQARIESAKLVKEKIKEIAGDEPAIVTGDFNVDQTHQSYRTMTGNGDMLDSYEVAAIRFAPNGTFNSYQTDNYTESRIDHVFITPNIKVEKYGVLTDTYRTDDGEASDVSLNAAPSEISAKKYTARTPSDHFPVMVVLELPKPEGFTSLKSVFDEIKEIPGMDYLDSKELKKSGLVDKQVAEAVFHANAEPRGQLLEIVSRIPDSLVEREEEDDTHRICRRYFNPLTPDSSVGEALFFVVGHGGNDTVVLYSPKIKASDLERFFIN